MSLWSKGSNGRPNLPRTKLFNLAWFWAIIVLVHGDDEGYEVEFASMDGEAVAVASLFANHIRPIGRREIA